MTVFGFNVAKKKEEVEKELNILLQNNCLQCYNAFDFMDRTPYLIYPCQHQFCKRCVEEDILDGEVSGVCPEDKNPVKKDNIKQSIILTQVIAIVTKYKEQSGFKEEIQQVESRIADDLYKCKIFYDCPSCQKPYDATSRQPNVICDNQHIVCSQCLKGKKLKKCLFCEEELFQEFVMSKLVMNASSFIGKIMFNERIKVIINDKEFSISTHAETRIKDIFFILQEYNHISKNLEINHCQFYPEPLLERFKDVQIDYNEKVGQQIKKIVVKYNEKAMKMGSKVTMPSKIMDQLAIKISNFQHVDQMKYPDIQEEQEESNVFGSKQKKIPSDLYPSFIKTEVKPANIGREDLVKKSKIFGSLHEEEREMIKAKKMSMVSRSQQEVELPNGTQIHEKYLENINSKRSEADRKNILSRFVQQHKIVPEDEKYLCYLIYKMVNTNFSEKQFLTSFEIERDLQEKAKDKDDTQSLVLCMLKTELQDGQIDVIFSPHSTDRSKISLKAITSHYLSDRFIITQKVDEDERWYFEKMYYSEEQFRKYVEHQKKKYSTRFNLNEQNIVVHNLIKGPNVLVFSTNQGYKMSKHLRYNVDKQIEIKPFFSQLELSHEDFSPKGFIEFKKSKEEIQFRGSWPYYQPIKAVRYGIEVFDKFDNGDNKWLKMNNNPGEWAVGFHGLRNPNQAYKHYKNVIQSVLAAIYREEKSMLPVVQNSKQAYSGDKCVNHSEEVGTGVYFSPMFSETLPYTEPQKFGQKSYRLVFQCRLKPSEIRIPESSQSFWVVHQPSAIRPYGIVLIEDEKARDYPSGLSQFKEEFKYSKYKAKIEGALKQVS